MPKEQIPADEVEVVDTFSQKDDSQERVRDHIEASLFSNLEEIKKIKGYSFIAIIFAIVQVFSDTFFWGIGAFLFAALDLWKGSRFTRRIDFVALFLAVLGILNAL